MAHAHAPHEPASPVVAVRQAVFVLQQERHVDHALEQRPGRSEGWARAKRRVSEVSLTTLLSGMRTTLVHHATRRGQPACTECCAQPLQRFNCAYSAMTRDSGTFFKLKLMNSYSRQKSGWARFRAP